MNLRDTYTTWRGLDWPKDTPEYQRHLKMWKKWREDAYQGGNFLSPVSEHFLAACRSLFSVEELTIHPWFETQAKAWTEDEFFVFWGCAGSGKSHFLGIAALLDYLTDPNCTYIAMASTTKDMLLLRSLASTIEYLRILRAKPHLYVPYKYVAQAYSVVPESTDDSNISSVKCRIKGVAVKQGTMEEARANLQGVHTRYVRLLLDELSAMPAAAAESRHNLAQCFDFKFGAACNPETVFGQEGVLAFPDDEAGWASVTPDTEAWKTVFGRAYRFDAFKSPAITRPGEFDFLPTEKKIDRIVQQNGGNRDAPAVWTFLRAYPPPQGEKRTVLTEATVKAYKMQDEPVWKGPTIKVAGIDPAFTSGGDKAVLQLAEIGNLVTGELVLSYGETKYLKIEASSPKPVVEQLVEQIIEILTAEGVSSDHVGVDDSGTQSVADALAVRIGLDLYRSNFARKPPELPISVSNYELAAVRYKNTVTWMYFTVLELGTRGQIRGLGSKAAEQMCQRRVLPKQQPLSLEAKDDFKKRTGGASPDEADACAVIAGMARERLGLLPGSTEYRPFGGLPVDAAETISMEQVRRVNNLELGQRYTVGA